MVRVMIGTTRRQRRNLAPGLRPRGAAGR